MYMEKRKKTNFSNRFLALKCITKKAAEVEFLLVDSAS
jgi:hypothetical protein